VDMHTIKPLDTDTLKSLFDRRLLVTLEEHSVVGGLGGAVAEYLAEQGGAPRLLRLGIPQGYGPAGEYAWMLEQCGLTAPQVTQQILGAVL